MGTTVLEKLNHFLTRLSRFHLQQAILFGSWATGERMEESDIDLILVSDDFEGIRFPERISRVRRSWPYEDGLDVLCYTLREFEEKRSKLGIVQTAAREGIWLSIPKGSA